jgi:hypothetical protein
MKTTGKPMQLTILFGMICGLTFIPMTMASSYMMYWPLSFRLIICLYLALYAFLLTRWGKGAVKFIVFPLLLLFITGIYSNSSIFFLLCLGILSWIRSSLCFQKSLLMMLVTEFAISLGGGALVAFFAPQSNLAWALGIWLFFLVQSLYFVFGENNTDVEKETQGIDSFERASRQTENILSTRLFN